MTKNRTLTMFAIVALLISTVFITGLAQQEYRDYVVINSQLILERSNMGKEIASQLERIQKSEQERLSQMQKRIVDLQKRLQNSSLNEGDRQNLTNQYQSQAIELRRHMEEAQIKLSRLSEQKLKELEARIMPAIKTHAREMGYKMIFDVSTSGLAYFDEHLDITNELVDLLNNMR
jgi:Skp family chaperone for outer membrane proteins